MSSTRSHPRPTILARAALHVVAPAALGLWALGAEGNVVATAVSAPRLGWALVGVGALLFIAAVIGAHKRPSDGVALRGVNALVAEPAFVGLTLCAGGLSLALGSAAGMWLVTPTLALAFAAFTFGHQRVDALGRGARTEPELLGLPLLSDAPPKALERLGALLVVMVPSLVVGKALTMLGVSSASPTPVVWAHAAATVLMVVGLVAASTRTALRRAVERAWLAVLVVALALVVGPGGPWGGTFDIRTAAVLPTVAALAVAPALRRPAAIALAVVAALAVQRVGFVARIDEVALTLGAGMVAWTHAFIWRVARRATERLANSWRDWRVGPIRIINHGAIGAVGCGVGVLAFATLVGPAHAWTVLGVTIAGIVGAALWAQVVEGSPSLARPYGFFGGLLGVVAFAFAAPWLGTPTWLVLGAGAAAAPVIQGVARLRCVANGCCHGAPCAPWLGIVYRHPMTRPVRLAQLDGVPLHPTQLYSSASNLVIGVVLARLWAAHASLAFIGGVYLLLMGLSRFVEEAWRGEPQTPVYRGLRLYQWVSIGCVVVGAALTCVRGAPLAPPPRFSVDGVEVTIVFMLITWLIASVDFPESKARFARLA